MSDNNFDKHNQLINREDDDSGAGGQSGIDFVDFTDSKSTRRDDLLPAEEMRHLLITHKEKHEGMVKQQKEARLQEKVAQKTNNYAAAPGSGGGGTSPHKEFPPLNKFGKSSLVDKTVSYSPNENDAKSNPELRNELTNKLDLRNRLTAQPQFNPRPSSF